MQGENGEHSPLHSSVMLINASDVTEREIRLATEDIHYIEQGGKTLYLIGTAHVSPASVRLVEETIAREQPDTVCIELCASRYTAMNQQDAWQQMDIAKVIREKRASLLLMQLLMASFQKRLAEKFSIQPGEEMLRAAALAEQQGAQLVLADREIRVTLLRAWRSMGFIAKWRLLTQVILSLFSTDKITAEEIEQLKTQDVLEVALQAVGDQFPALKRSLIDERDQYLADMIGHAPGRCVVAVVGAGHVPGVLRNLETVVDRQKLDEIPPPGLAGRVFGWSFPLLVVALFIVGFFTSGARAGLRMITSWAVITGAFAGAGAAMLLAHPFTILGSALAAPITTLHPLIAAGWVAGLIEAAVRQPQVKDFLALPADIGSLRGFFRNKITRILLLVTWVNLTTSIGTFVAIPMIMRFF